MVRPVDPFPPPPPKKSAPERDIAKEFVCTFCCTMRSDATKKCSTCGAYAVERVVPIKIYPR